MARHVMNDATSSTEAESTALLHFPDENNRLAMIIPFDHIRYICSFWSRSLNSFIDVNSSLTNSVQNRLSDHIMDLMTTSGLVAFLPVIHSLWFSFQVRFIEALTCWYFKLHLAGLTKSPFLPSMPDPNSFFQHLFESSFVWSSHYEVSLYDLTESFDHISF